MRCVYVCVWGGIANAALTVSFPFFFCAGQDCAAVIGAFPALEHLFLSTHPAPTRAVVALTELRTLQCAGRLEPTFLKKFAAANKSLTSLDLSRVDLEGDRTVVGLMNVKVRTSGGARVFFFFSRRHRWLR